MGGGMGGTMASKGSPGGGMSQTFKKPRTLVCYIW